MYTRMSFLWDGYMNNEYEFTYINIFLGGFIILLILNIILEILSQMHIGLGFACIIVMGILYVKTFMIMYGELKIWTNISVH